MKKLVLVILLAIGVSFFAGDSYAMSGMCGMSEAQAKGESSLETKEEAKAIAVGNKICPVTGETIQEKSKVQYTYEGKVYNFCCPMCIDEFKKDSEKYIEKEKQAGSKKETTSKTTRSEHQGHHH